MRLDRLLERLRCDHPQLPLIIVADSLYSKAPTIKQIIEKRMSFLLVAKPADHKSLYTDIEGLRRGKMLERKRRVENRGKNSERRYLYEWTNGVALGVDAAGPTVNYIQLTISKADGKRTFTNSWVTDMEVTAENVEDLVRGARARWKIENEGFNTLKNHGYHLEHNFGKAPAKADEEQEVRVLCAEGVACHRTPDHASAFRKAGGEALDREYAGEVLSFERCYPGCRPSPKWGKATWGTAIRQGVPRPAESLAPLHA